MEEMFFTAKVERIASNGAGIVTYMGRRFFVEGAAPLDRVAVRVVDGAAELLELLEPSPARVEPACPLFGSCGGCSLQHIAYKAQIAEKVEMIRDAFVRIGGFEEPPAARVCQGEPWGYRNRVQFHRAGAGGVGFKARRSGDVVPVEACMVADAGINHALAEKRIKPPVEKDRWTVFSYKDAFLSEGERGRGGAVLLDRRIALDAGVFFQSNARLLEPLIRDVIPLAREAAACSARAGGAALLDLYCGVGTFAAFLGEGFDSLTLVEENKAAIGIARENVRENAAFFAMKADAWVAAAGAKKRFDFVIADPPREGLSPGAREWLAACPAPVFVYVSCNPATLARDAGVLTRGGYKLESLAFYDFYPQTPHAESAAVFRR